MRAGKRKIEKCEPGRVFFAPALISSLKKKEMNIIGKDVSVLIEEESIVKKKDKEFQTMKETGRIVFILRKP